MNPFIPAGWLAALLALGGVGEQRPARPAPAWELRSVLRLGQDASTSSLAFSPDGSKLAASLIDANHGGVELWEVASGKLRTRSI